MASSVLIGTRALRPSRLYEVRVRYEIRRDPPRFGEWVRIDRVFRARFMEEGQFRELWFSYRPLGGIQAVPRGWIYSLRECQLKEGVCLPYDPLERRSDGEDAPAVPEGHA